MITILENLRDFVVTLSEYVVSFFKTVWYGILSLVRIVSFAHEMLYTGILPPLLLLFAFMFVAIFIVNRVWFGNNSN